MTATGRSRRDPPYAYPKAAHAKGVTVVIATLLLAVGVVLLLVALLGFLGVLGVDAVALLAVGVVCLVAYAVVRRPSGAP